VRGVLETVGDAEQLRERDIVPSRHGAAIEDLQADVAGLAWLMKASRSVPAQIKGDNPVTVFLGERGWRCRMHGRPLDLVEDVWHRMLSAA
jgi:hypothetical protein